MWLGVGNFSYKAGNKASTATNMHSRLRLEMGDNCDTMESEESSSMQWRNGYHAITHNDKVGFYMVFSLTGKSMHRQFCK